VSTIYVTTVTAFLLTVFDVEDSFLAKLGWNLIRKDMNVKKVLTFVVVAVLSVSSVNAAGNGQGSNFGSFATASSRGIGAGSFTLGAGIADQNSFLGMFNYGLSRFTEGTVKLALVDFNNKFNDNLEFAIGADFRYQFMVVDDVSKSPFDMAVGAFFELVNPGTSVLQLGGQLIGSYPIKLSTGKILTPYGRFNVRVEKAGGNSDLNFGLNTGVSWGLSSTIRLFGEFQFDGNDGIFLGVDLQAL